MKLIFGLGNPGKRFEETRHNIGFRIIDKLAELLYIDVRKRAHASLFGQGNVEGEKVILAKPLAYMNKSGHAVSSFLCYYRVLPEDLLVIYDDADLEVGCLRIRSRGGAGGHRGIESIISCLGREDFPRLRIGIKGKGRDSRLADYVLKKFDEEERIIVDRVVAEAAEAVQCLIKEGVANAMNKYNRSNRRNDKTQNPNDLGF
ncbi:MAG: aminoacyl-tRNA hydrolase [Nitrospirae bacterium]|nr:aminoacyl-tRNA hydrolase [Nitrospirota bacterium]